MARRDLRVTPRFFGERFEKLLADNGDFGTGDFEAHEAMLGVKVENDFEVGGSDAEAFVGFAFSGDGAYRLDADGTGREFLGNQNREGLLAAFGPVIDLGEYAVLVVEIVVENGYERGVEGHVLFEGARALHFQGDFGDSVRKQDVGAVRFFRLRAPLITDGSAVGLESEHAADARGSGVGRFQIGGFAGGPASAGGRNLEVFVTDILTVQANIKLAFVLREDRRSRGSGFLVIRDSRARENEQR
jgi:hypothetical protein